MIFNLNILWSHSIFPSSFSPLLSSSLSKLKFFLKKQKAKTQYNKSKKTKYNITPKVNKQANKNNLPNYYQIKVHAERDTMEFIIYWYKWQL